MEKTTFEEALESLEKGDFDNLDEDKTWFKLHLDKNHDSVIYMNLKELKLFNNLQKDLDKEFEHIIMWGYPSETNKKI